MKRTIYEFTKAFRCTNLLHEKLRSLADKTNRHESDLIRQAVAQYVSYYADHPDELVKVA
jgi:predicted transcriptional regulator